MVGRLKANAALIPCLADASRWFLGLAEVEFAVLDPVEEAVPLVPREHADRSAGSSVSRINTQSCPATLANATSMAPGWPDERRHSSVPYTAGSRCLRRAPGLVR